MMVVASMIAGEGAAGSVMVTLPVALLRENFVTFVVYVGLDKPRALAVRLAFVVAKGMLESAAAAVQLPQRQVYRRLGPAGLAT